jgi:hypothetical protein
VQAWPAHPRILEINTWVWLSELEARSGTPVDLRTVPAEAWDEAAAREVDAVWLMGVWERSPEGVRQSLAPGALRAEYDRALPGWTEADVSGSPYAVRAYTAAARLGGAEGLERAREELSRRGLRLLLDFVPNHTAIDHGWVSAYPEFYLRAGAGDVTIGDDGSPIACGRDPFYPPWRDTAQVDAFHPGMRQAAIDTLDGIAAQCDGVRCDMAMLLLNDVFAKTWAGRCTAAPAQEYWSEVIGAVRPAHPEFLFLAEVYWGREDRLLELGFDYCYDKRFYDLLRHEGAESIRLHLGGDPQRQARLLRFLENHDEPRAATVFQAQRHRAAAVALFTLPGARLLQAGQAEGRRVKLPVRLGRAPKEPPDPLLAEFYQSLLAETAAAVYRGEWRLCEQSGWTDNPTTRHLVSWCWRQGPERRLVVLNLSGEAAQGRVHYPWEDLASGTLTLREALGVEQYQRDGGEMRQPGLYVELPPWGCHVFAFETPGASA